MASEFTTGPSTIPGAGRLFRLVLYNLGLLLAAPIGLAVALVQAITDRRVRDGHRYRFGLKLPPKPKREAIWLHAVSVGEVNGISRLAELILDAGRYELYLSTTTASGFAVAQRRFGGRAVVFYFPLDVPPLIRRFIRVIQPAAMIIAEVEIWPNFLASLQEANVPVWLVNGRIGPKEFAGYRRLRWFFAPFYRIYRGIFAQSHADRQRMVEIGMPPPSIRVINNLKADLTYSADDDQAAKLRRLIPSDRTVIVAGSTHAPEERQILSSCRSVTGDIFLILAPRDTDRAEELRQLCRTHGLSARLLEETGELRQPVDVLIVNTMGDLPHFYRFADIVIMGGSLSPHVGGHNLLEPLYFAKPVITGPWVQSFFEIEGGIRKVDGPEQIASAISELISDPAQRNAIAAKGHQLLLSCRGGSQETYTAIFGADGTVRPSVHGEDVCG